MSGHLHDHAAVGHLLDVSAPAGDFVVPESGEPLLLASAGAGITTVLPIVEHIARTQPERTVIVAHATHRAGPRAAHHGAAHARAGVLAAGGRAGRARARDRTRRTVRLWRGGRRVRVDQP